MTQIIMLRDHVFSADGVHTVQFAARTKQDVSPELARHWIDEGIAEIDGERVADGIERSPSPTPAEPAAVPPSVAQGQSLTGAPENQSLTGAPETKSSEPAVKLTKTSKNEELSAELERRGVTAPDGATKAVLLAQLGLDGDAPELTDESTVAELRNELERRGIAAPASDAHKADLQALLGYTPTLADPAAAGE
jgi:hypothetical protein